MKKTILEVMVFLALVFGAAAADAGDTLHEYVVTVKYVKVVEWAIKAKNIDEVFQQIEEWQFLDEETIDLQDLEILDEPRQVQ